jgi:hypothetical protein
MFSVPRVLRRSGGRALASAFLIAAVLVSGVAAKDQKSLKGTATETFTATACPSPAPTLFCAASTGTGEFSHLGKMTSSYLGIVDFAQPQGPGCYAVASNGTLTSRQGDQLVVLDVGTFCQTSATAAMVTGNFTITGGTGRFIGATGGGTYTAPTIFNDTFTGGSSDEVYTGTISLP